MPPFKIDITVTKSGLFVDLQNATVYMLDNCLKIKGWHIHCSDSGSSETYF